MNLRNTTKKNTENTTTLIFKYLGLADEKDCPNCAENAFFTYSFECPQTKKQFNSCFDCLEKRTSPAEPLISVINLSKKPSYPVKDFLLSHSKLVKLYEKEASGKEWNTAELAQEARIFNERDKAMYNIKRELSKYYDIAINGDYRIDGMPEIEKGVRGWIERKIWKLLVSIGEPDALRYKNDPDNENFWEEVK